MRYRPPIRTLLAVAFIGACVAYAKAMFWLPAIAAPQGDGVFENTSRRAGPFAIPGYSITFPEFELSTRFEAEYHFSELADIDCRCLAYFAIRDPDDKCDAGRARTRGKIQIELIDSQGREVVNVSGSPSDFIWYGCRDMHGLYQLNRSSFFPQPAEKYTIRVRYEPEPSLAGFKGYLFLECGGHK